MPACRSYVNYQALALYGSWRRAQRMPGGEKMVALTRVLHRSADDDLSPYVPTFRVAPRHPGAWEGWLLGDGEQLFCWFTTGC